MYTTLDNLTPDERQRLFLGYAIVHAEVKIREKWQSTSIWRVRGDCHAFVGGVVLWSNVRITHEQLHELEREERERNAA